MHHFKYPIKLRTSNMQYLTKHDVASGKQFQVSHAVFFYFSARDKTVSQPVRPYQNGSARYTSSTSSQLRYVLEANSGTCLSHDQFTVCLLLNQRKHTEI